MQIFIGVLFILGGLAVTWKARWLYNNFGAIAWAEAKIGSTTFFYQIMGVVFVILGMLILGGDIQTGLSEVLIRDNSQF